MLTVTNPMVRVEPVTSARAAVFGRYPSSAIARSTRSRVSGATLGEPLMTRDTVWWETPARAATSDMTSARVVPAGCTDLLRPGRRPGQGAEGQPRRPGRRGCAARWSAGSAGGAGPPLVVDVERDGQQQDQALDHGLDGLVDAHQLHAVAHHTDPQT